MASMSRVKIKLVFFAAILSVISLQTEGFSQIWKDKPIHKLTFPQYEATLNLWANKFKDRLSLEKIGATLEGTPIYMLKITNKDIPDDDKQVALLSALHGGPERSGSTGIMALTEWLLSNDKEAVETRKKQVVLIIPIINHYSYFVKEQPGNSQNIDAYTGGGASNWDFEKLKYKKPDKSPEIAAFLDVVDRYTPDINVDFHGTGLSYSGQIMFEVSGTAYSNSVLRPWDWRITEAIVEAGRKAGFPSDRAEADAQQMQSVPGLGKMEGQAWRGRPQFYTAQYAYLKYHTLLSALEIAWEASAVARGRGMLGIGNRIWPGENKSGYPVNKVHAFVGRYVTSFGNTPGQQRESRIELWQKQTAFSHGVIYPETEGRESFVVGLTPEGSKMMESNLTSFVNNLRSDTSINATSIEAYIKKGPERILSIEKSIKTALLQGRIQNGLGLRLRIPYANAKIEDIRLNGHALQKNSSDGYETWIGDGYLQVQINVPPQKASRMDIAIVTCEYKPGLKRTYGWQPPKEVLDALK